MFNLDQSIAEWRRQMSVSGIKSSRVLDELESHLRDDLEEQVGAGATPQQAFERAVERLGEAAALEGEFEKVGETGEAPERARNVMLTLAGIPNQYLNEPMNTSSTNLEPRWATYLKAGAFLLPALFLWALSSVFVVPKLQQICVDAGFFPGSRVFWNVTYSNITATLFFREYGVFIFGGVILMLIMLEWRSHKWPRYRRAAVGAGTFLLNAIVLISIFLMVIVALVAAPALMNHAK